LKSKQFKRMIKEEHEKWGRPCWENWVLGTIEFHEKYPTFESLLKSKGLTFDDLNPKDPKKVN
jgi:hypothetical protein